MTVRYSLLSMFAAVLVVAVNIGSLVVSGTALRVMAGSCVLALMNLHLLRALCTSRMRQFTSWALLVTGSAYLAFVLYLTISEMILCMILLGIVGLFPYADLCVKAIEVGK